MNYQQSHRFIVKVTLHCPTGMLLSGDPRWAGAWLMTAHGEIWALVPVVIHSAHEARPPHEPIIMFMLNRSRILVYVIYDLHEQIIFNIILYNEVQYMFLGYR